MKPKLTFAKMMRAFKTTLIVAVICFAPLFSSAQDEGLPCDGTDVDIQCPIDGGVTALLAAGAFFGIKKLKIK